MFKFLDLEPILGTSDILWEDLITEISNYPFKQEQGYAALGNHANSTAIIRQHLRKIKNNSSSETFQDPNVSMLKKSWTEEWDRTYDTRITLVKQRDENGEFLDGEILQDRIKYFQKTWNYINSLPITKFFRVILINGSPNNSLPLHNDLTNFNDPYNNRKLHNIVINPRNNRAFYYKDNNKNIFTNSSIFLFNNHNYKHGVLAQSHYTSLIRIYCILDRDFCKQNCIYEVEE